MLDIANLFTPEQSREERLATMLHYTECAVRKAHGCDCGWMAEELGHATDKWHAPIHKAYLERAKFLIDGARL